MNARVIKYWLHIAFVLSLIAVLGSLYFSEIAQYPPCVLCWYQRTVMYPLPILFAVAILRKDDSVRHYALPLIAIGLLIAMYHNLLYYGVLPEAEFTCKEGISCTTKFVEYFGFLTIPLMSLIAFLSLGALMLIKPKAG